MSGRTVQQPGRQARHRPARLRRWLALAALLSLGTGAGAQAPSTGTPAGARPTADALAQAFRLTPAWQAATLSRQAEQASLRQGLAGAQEWTASLSAQRWRQTDGSAPAQWQDWELGLDRPLRLPGKRDAAQALGQARVASAEAALQRAWREFGRQYLQLWGDGQREAAAAREAEALVALLQRQAQAVATRQRLGDAARIESAQAQAALAQAQAQAQAAAARALQARHMLQALFAGAASDATIDAAIDVTIDGSIDAAPGAAMDGAGQAAASAADPADPADPAGPAGPRVDALVEAQLQHSTELAQARRDAAALRALAAQEQAERRPDPSVGLRLGSSRGGAERMVGVVLSLPIGGAAREAGAAAAALRAAAAAQQADELARQLRAEALRRVREPHTAAAVHQRQREAAQRLAGVADTLARGFALGEGSLAELLAARRLAHEQALLAATSGVERQLAALRLRLEAGQLWPWPGAPDAPVAPAAPVAPR